MFTFLSLHLSLLAFTGLSLFQAARALPLSASNSTSVQNQDDSFNTLVSLAPFADPPRNKTSVQKVKVQVTALPNADIDAFVPYTRLASASYCSTAQIKNWTCGQHCGALPGMVIYDAGGNNQDVPFWYVGYLPSLQSAVVAHQGTTPSELKSVLVDTTFHLGSLNAKYFPGIDSSVQVHQGFSTCHGKTADRINSAVKQMINDHSITNVVTVGHSLGGALAVLDAMSLQMVLPSTVRFKVVTFGQPRIGNQQFADFMDAHLSDISRLTHNDDVVPILPGRFLGFHHSSGERHIDPDGQWWICDGQDNGADPQCSTGEVGNILEGSVSDHTGPYAGGILMGC